MRRSTAPSAPRNRDEFPGAVAPGFDGPHAGSACGDNGRMCSCRAGKPSEFLSLLVFALLGEECLVRNAARRLLDKFLPVNFRYFRIQVDDHLEVGVRRSRWHAQVQNAVRPGLTVRLNGSHDSPPALI